MLVPLIEQRMVELSPCSHLNGLKWLDYYVYGIYVRAYCIITYTENISESV